MEKSVNILDIREKIPNDLFTSLELNVLLEGYRNKGAKIALWLRHGEIIPLRRGLYTFAEPLRRGLLSKDEIGMILPGMQESIQNMICGIWKIEQDNPAITCKINH